LSYAPVTVVVVVVTVVVVATGGVRCEANTTSQVPMSNYVDFSTILITSSRVNGGSGMVVLLLVPRRNRSLRSKLLYWWLFLFFSKEICSLETKRDSK